MKTIHWVQSAVAVAMPLLMAIPVRAAEPVAPMGNDTPEATASSSGALSAVSGGQAVCCDSGAYDGYLKCDGDDCPQFECYWFSGVDSFKGVSDGNYDANSGLFTGLNSGFALPVLCKYGIGGQAGMSCGIYDLAGRASQSDVSPGQDQQQVFVTAGIFRRADANCPISAGIVYDWMFDNNFGGYGAAPTLGQLRGQIAYDLNDCNEVGVWGTYRGQSFGNSFGANGYPLEFRAVDQVDLFWHHKFGECGADGRLYVGLPTADRLTQTNTGFSSAGFGGKPGSVIMGANCEAPLNDRLSLFANGTYMAPDQAAGATAAAQETWNFSFGINVYLGRSRSRCPTVAGNSFLPYLPVANNGSFLVDTNETQP